MKTIKVITDNGVMVGTKLEKRKYGLVLAHWIDPVDHGDCSWPAKKIESLNPDEVWYRLDGVKLLSPAEEIELDERSCYTGYSGW